jgi:hypothetical protein
MQQQQFLQKKYMAHDAANKNSESKITPVG